MSVMCRWIIVVIICVISGSAKAQTFNEWFRQKKTQREYLTKQIALYKVYGEFLKKGYNIAKDGLHLIGNIKNGDLNLHAEYFNSLRTVSPRVQKYIKVAQINAYFRQIIQQSRQSLSRVKLSMKKSSEHYDYVSEVYENLLNKAGDQIAMLVDVLTDGVYELSEDARIEVVDKIYNDISDMYTFCQNFSTNNDQYMIQVEKDMSDYFLLKRLHNLE